MTSGLPYLFLSSFDKKGRGVGIVLEGPNNTLIEHSLAFKFKVSNHHIEYEALIGGLTLAKVLRAY